MTDSTLLTAIATVLRQPVNKEFCADCGSVFPEGTHSWVDIDGEEHPACLNHSRPLAHLYGMRAFLDIDAPDPGMKLARGYRVR